MILFYIVLTKLQDAFYKFKKFKIIFKIYRVPTLPGNLEKPRKTWNFDQKNLEKPGIFNNKTLSALKFQFDTINLSYK